MDTDVNDEYLVECDTNEYDAKVSFFTELLNTTPINGYWNDEYKIWLYPHGNNMLLLLDKLYGILDVKQHLPRNVNKQTFKHSYCIACKKQVPHNHQYYSPHTGYATDEWYHKHKTIDEIKFLVSNDKLNWIEHIIFHECSELIKSLKPIKWCTSISNGRVLNIKTRQLRYVDGKFTITKERTENINSHMFINIDITEEDISNYKYDEPNLYLMELFNGSEEQYNTFMQSIININSDADNIKDRCHFVIGNAHNKMILKSILLKLYKKFVNYNGSVAYGDRIKTSYAKKLYIIDKNPKSQTVLYARLSVISNDDCAQKHAYVFINNVTSIKNIYDNKLHRCARTAKQSNMFKLIDNKLLPLSHDTLVKIVLDSCAHSKFT